MRKVGDRRKTQQSTAQLISDPLPQSPVKKPNCQSRNTQKAAGLEVIWKLFLKKLLSPDILYVKGSQKEVQFN